MTINRLRRRLVIAAIAGVLAIVGGLGLAVRANAAATPANPRPDVLPAVAAPVVPATVTHVAPAATVAANASGCETEQLTVLAPEHC